MMIKTNINKMDNAIKINGTTCSIAALGEYESGGLCLQAIETESGEPYMHITTNIPQHWECVWRGTPTAKQYPIKPYIVIKDYSENEGISDILKESGVIDDYARIANCDGMFKLAKISEAWCKILKI
jgi:hypothetical protein